PTRRCVERPSQLGPAPSSVGTCPKALKDELQRELHRSRPESGCGFTEIRWHIEQIVWQIQVHAVEEVEGLGAELQVEFAWKWNAPEERGVDLSKARTLEGVAAEVAVFSDGKRRQRTCRNEGGSGIGIDEVRDLENAVEVVGTAEAGFVIAEGGCVG